MRAPDLPPPPPLQALVPRAGSASPPVCQIPGALGQRRGWRGGGAAAPLPGPLVDAAVGGGAPAVDVEEVAILLVVHPLLETQGHALVTLAGLPVTGRLVEISCGEGSACTLRVQGPEGQLDQHRPRAHPRPVSPAALGWPAACVHGPPGGCGSCQAPRTIESSCHGIVGKLRPEGEPVYRSHPAKPRQRWDKTQVWGTVFNHRAAGHPRGRACEPRIQRGERFLPRSQCARPGNCRCCRWVTNISFQKSVAPVVPALGERGTSCGLVPTRCPAPPSASSFGCSRSGRGLITCISNKCLGDTDAEGQGTPSGNHALANGLQIFRPFYQQNPFL